MSGTGNEGRQKVVVHVSGKVPSCGAGVLGGRMGRLVGTLEAKYDVQVNCYFWTSDESAPRFIQRLQGAVGTSIVNTSLFDEQDVNSSLLMNLLPRSIVASESRAVRSFPFQYFLISNYRRADASTIHIRIRPDLVVFCNDRLIAAVGDVKKGGCDVVSESNCVALKKQASDKLIVLNGRAFSLYINIYSTVANHIRYVEEGIDYWQIPVGERFLKQYWNKNGIHQEPMDLCCRLYRRRGDIPIGYIRNRISKMRHDEFS